MNCITINTDASFYPNTKAGGFAFWIVCDRFVIKKAGKFQKISNDPSDAEVKSIANAIKILLDQTDLPKTNLIIINTDSTCAMDYITNQRTPNGRTAARLLFKLKNAMDASRWEFRHVKAHTGANNARSKVNEWCDNEAKKFMRKHRKDLQK